MAAPNAALYAELAENGEKFKFIAVFKGAIKSEGPAKVLDALREAGNLAGEKMGQLAMQAIVDMTLKTPPTRRIPEAVQVLAELGPTGGVQNIAAAETVGFQLIQNGDATVLKPASVLLKAHGILPDCSNMTPNVRNQIAEKMLAVTRFRGAGHVSNALENLPGLLSKEGRKTVLQRADDSGFFTEAEGLAQILSQEEQQHVINYRLSKGFHRAAARAVHLYKMEAEFTDCDYVWRSDAFNSAMTKGHAKVMMGLAIAEPRLREQAVEALMNWSMPMLAADAASQWGLPLPAGAQHILGKTKSKITKYNLQLPSDFVVHFIASYSVESNLVDGIDAMLNAPAVGIYLETSPISSLPDASMQHPTVSTPSVLSISTPDAGFVFNLETLGGDEAFAGMVEQLLKAKHIAKVGIGVAGDLEKLASCYPLLAKCKEEAEFLVEVDQTVVARSVYENMVKPTPVRMAAPGSPPGSPRSRREKEKEHQSYDGKPITGLAEKFLGKPLSTCMAISDWTQHRLSETQLRYASLNAFVPLQIYILCLAYGLPVLHPELW